MGINALKKQLLLDAGVENVLSAFGSKIKKVTKNYVIILLVALVEIFPIAAEARFKPEYAQLPQAERDWYSSRVLTPEAEARFHFKSCCAHSDTVQTKFRVDKSTGADQWFWLDEGTWRRIPPDIIHPDEHNPNGQGTLFVIPGRNEPTCFFPPDAGG